MYIVQLGKATGGKGAGGGGETSLPLSLLVGFGAADMYVLYRMIGRPHREKWIGMRLIKEYI